MIIDLVWWKWPLIMETTVHAKSFYEREIGVAKGVRPYKDNYVVKTLSLRFPHRQIFLSSLKWPPFLRVFSKGWTEYKKKTEIE